MGQIMRKRALVTLPDGVWRVIDELKGTLGDGDSEVIRNIVIAYLSERGILIPTYNLEATATTADKVDYAKRINPELILEALAEILVEKGIINRNELARSVHKARGVTRDVSH